jgi:hypothetical protein
VVNACRSQGHRLTTFWFGTARTLEGSSFSSRRKTGSPSSDRYGAAGSPKADDSTYPEPHIHLAIDRDSFASRFSRQLPSKIDDRCDGYIPVRGRRDLRLLTAPSLVRPGDEGCR